MFWAWILVLNIAGLVFDLFGHHVMAHLGIPKSISAQSQYLSILFS